MPVTMRALIQRINRKLRPELEGLKTTRSERLRLDFGDYYVIDYRGNYVTHKDVDPETLGRELGVLQDWEEVAKEGGV